jgi:predicted enzyme related to lactoylglutathione lyase
VGDEHPEHARPRGRRRLLPKLFGWETDRFGPFTLFRLPGFVGGEPAQPVPRDVVAAMAPAQPGDTAARWDVDFWVRDAEQAARRAAEGGGSVIGEVQDAPPFKRVVLADPGGAGFSASALMR